MKSTSNLVWALVLFAPALSAQVLAIPDIREPVAAQFHTTTHWVCDHDDAPPITVEVTYGNQPIPGLSVRVSRIEAVRTDRQSISPSLLAEVNTWLADKSIDSASVECHLPTRTVIDVYAWPRDGEEAVAFRLIADGEGHLRKAE